MRDEWRPFNMMVSRVRTHLHQSEHEPLWQGQNPFLESRVVEMEVTADALGLFGDKQSTPTTGATAQQNVFETALEDGAYTMGHLLHLSTTGSRDTWPRRSTGD